MVCISGSLVSVEERGGDWLGGTEGRSTLPDSGGFYEAP